MGGEYWMADFFIEYHPDKSSFTGGHVFWWQFPRMNYLSYKIFNRESRILLNKFPSVLMKRGYPRINLSLPHESHIFTFLTTKSEKVFDSSDVRSKKKVSGRSPYSLAEKSEKGRYLSGLLELFGGLFPASKCFESNYWRCMFDLLCGRHQQKDDSQLETVKNSLQKKLRANPAQFYEDNKFMTWLANVVLKTSKNLPKNIQDRTFDVFMHYAKKELEDFNSRNPDQKPWEFSQNDLLAAVSALTNCGILLMGFQIKCPFCGYREWHHIDQVKQNLRCAGCNEMFSFPPEQPWCYRLNNLVRASYAEHGLLPVILILGQLFMDSKTSFMFSPCLDLFERDNNKPIGDLDIAVILDGKFLIGEVKQSRDRFSVATFAKMGSIAKRLLPDRLLFSAMDREPNDLIKKEIERLSAELKPLGISVSWYPLQKYIFDPSPIR